MSDQPPTAPGGDVVVYVELLDEGVEVYRPVLAAEEGGAYRLPPGAPKGEIWAMAPGALVRCKRLEGSLYAIEQTSAI